MGVAAGGIQAAEDRLDAGRHLADAERLGHVVVGSDVEPDELVDLFGAGGQHHHIDRLTTPNGAENLKAVNVGQAEVEQDEVDSRTLPTQQPQVLQRLSAGGGLQHPVALRDQVLAEDLSDAGLVVNHQHGSAHLPIVPRPSQPTARLHEGFTGDSSKSRHDRR
ncbi:hypothetical protein SDC9_123674 [bioreactor metagenome]|uniref:Uncharacterized protein n=1 Tax=bioreactor metagenome TaxID=1076179 RepID=A0A645CIB0_9ZZZZ